MPAALAVDWIAVQSTYASTDGNAEATAKAHGIDSGAVRQRAARGQWKLAIAKAKAEAGLEVRRPVPAKAEPVGVTAVTKAVTSLGEKTKSRLARGLARGALRVAHMKGETVLNRAPEIKALVDSAAKVHGWQNQQGGTAFLGLHVTVRADQAQVVDVDAEVMPPASSEESA